jgi:tripartite-type tricarboxylate transporter receptor subunit TctC
MHVKPRMKYGRLFRRHCRAARLGVAALVALICCAPGLSAQPFYAGKQITLIAGSGVGGGYDLLARMTARHLGRLIPGHPTVIVQNMPAAGESRRHQSDLQHRP